MTSGFSTTDLPRRTGIMGNHMRICWPSSIIDYDCDELHTHRNWKLIGCEHLKISLNLAMANEFLICRRLFFCLIVSVLAHSVKISQAEDTDSNAVTKSPVDFRTQIFPLLKTRCFACHQGQEAESGVRLDDRAELLGETTGNPLVRMGLSDESRLIQIVSGEIKDLIMPPKGERLTPLEVNLLRAWIDQGLDWDTALLPAVKFRSDHWAFRPVVRPTVPVVDARRIVRNPVDAFLASEQEKQGLTPTPEANRRVLIRRLSLDLWGLTPHPLEVQSFSEDEAPDAYERLVDRLLASPHYGERWGRHWLDLARWAESEGYESNHPRPFAWRYRDYVVQSFNMDKPYNLFVRQQLAGDELTPYSDENLIATGFLAAARISSNEEDKWLQRNAVLVDVVNATGQAFLGLTLNCAQCHNHKFDPITTRDYYRMMGFFQQGQPVDLALSDVSLRREYDLKRPADYEPARQLKQVLYELARDRRSKSVREKLTLEQRSAIDTPVDRRSVPQELLVRQIALKFQATPNEIEKHVAESDRKLYEELKRKITEIEKNGTLEPQTFAYYSPVTSPHHLKVLPTIGFFPLPFDPEEMSQLRPYIRIRGEVNAIGPTVEPGWPAVFDQVLPSTPENTKKRTALVDWLVDNRHPLTARVWANRVWQYHFGRGIVSTSGDFGVKGDRPSHPELLDWLASELIDNGWSTKHLHRLIVLSQAYRQAANVETTAAVEAVPNSNGERPGDMRNFARDPRNVFLWHWSPRRLESEVLRDITLLAAGELDETVGGPSILNPDGKDSPRRSLYLFQKRGVPPEMQKLFDGPSEMAESCTHRHTSTTALQSLFLLNHPFILRRASVLARKIEAEAGANIERQITLVFLRTVGRPPDEVERQAAESFLEENVELAPAARLEQFCTAMLNSDEFAYIE